MGEERGSGRPEKGRGSRGGERKVGGAGKKSMGSGSLNDLINVSIG